MAFELPTFTKCCFCVSMRKGLMCWACFIIVTQILMTILYAAALSDRSSLIKQWFTPSMCLMVADTVFGVVLLIAAAKMSAGWLRVYYFYGVLSIVVRTVLMVMLISKYMSGQIYFDNAPKTAVWEHVISFGGREILQILLQLYVVLLVKSAISGATSKSRQPPVNQQGRV